jgi:hypothetical protein
MRFGVDLQVQAFTQRLDVVLWQRSRLAIETHQPYHAGESQYAQPLLQVKMYEHVTGEER